MTTPNNQPPSPIPPFAITGGNSGTDTSADLGARTQDAIIALLGQTQIAQSPGFNASTAAVYSGLRRGTPGAPVPLWLAQLEQVAQSVFGGTSQTWDSVADLLADVEDFFSGNWGALTNIGGDLSALFQILFGGVSNPALGGSIPAPTVIDASQYAQPVSNFPNADSIVPGGGWSWDGTTSYGGSGGSLLYAASGAMGRMRGIVVAVQPGQFVALAAELQWAGLTATNSNQVQLQLIPYSGTATALVTGTPEVIAQMSPFGSSGGWVALTGSYKVPPSGVTFVQMCPVVTADAAAGSIWFAACTESISGGYLATLEADLADLSNEATASAAAWSTLLQSIGSAITNYTDWPTFAAALQSAWTTFNTTESQIEAAETFTLQQFFNTLLGINANGQTQLSAIEGVSGAQDLATTFTNLINQLGAALGGDVADAGGFAWLAQLMNSLGVSSTSPIAPLISSAQTSAQILAIVDNQPVAAGLESTVVSNGDYHQAVALSSATVTQTTSRGAIITVDQAKTLGFQQWLGEYTSSPSGFVINFYKMDSSGNLDYLFSTADLSASLTSSLAWLLEDVTAISANASDVIGVELQIKTSGTIVPWGFTAPPAGNHPTALIKQLGFSQNWAGSTASTIPAASIGWSPSAPYIGLGVGTPPPTPFFPQSNTLTISGNYTIQSWDLFVDLVGVSGGGGGEGETGLGNGPGGCGGSWGTRTLTVGASGPTGIVAGATITVTIAAGGAGGPYFTPGSPGNDTTFSWLDHAGATQTLTCAGGLAGNAINNLTSFGLSPGNQTFQNQIYIGGSANIIGGFGNPPGGGGSGGAAFQFGFAGAAGQAWIVDRQT